MGERVKEHATISKQQLFFMLLQIHVGVGILSLPYVVHREAGKDGWISILLAGILVQAGIAIIWLLSSRFPNKTLYDFAPLVLGRAVGFVLNTLYVVFFFIIACYTLAIFLSVSANWVFHYTPRSVFAVIVIGITVYLIKENIRIIARFSTLTSFLLAAVFLLFLFMVNDLNVRYLLPVGSAGTPAILTGAEQALFSFTGFEMLLLLFPLTKASGKEKWKAAASASGIVAVLYALLAAFSYMYFSSDKLKHVPEPVLYMVRSMELGVIERVDLIFLSAWAVFAITTFMSYLHAAALGAARLVKAEHHRKAVYWLAALVLPVSLYAENSNELERISGTIGTWSSLFLFALPVFLLIIAMMRKKREESS
ncbi:spore germination protein [Domibacillus sp. A3M-37]|uniref:GerAB/ArcD/ProY family transporter n=1 Tax=Domibacillus sp. A3M-37 TaxID=2962037 RepID=UPI0020B7A44D|nr:GerAB/ArcD/ProY family transporter [Domibacillus sp. A3M-37]MCP3761181.1 spore germination protein [Domibacillus sp. A3M-37]